MMGFMVVLFLFVGEGETSTLFAIVVVPLDNPTNSVQGFPFLHIIANT